MQTSQGATKDGQKGVQKTEQSTGHERTSQSQHVQLNALQSSIQNPQISRPETILQMQRLLGNQATCQRIAADKISPQPSSGSIAVQRMKGSQFFDPMAELAEADESESESDEVGPREDFLDTVRNYEFDDITTPEFRKNHVVNPGGKGLVGEAESVAKDRDKPTSTSVLFTKKDKDNLVKEIKKKTLKFKQDKEPSSLQKQITTDKYLFVEYQKTKNGKFRMRDAGFGNIAYAAEGVKIYGGQMYEVNHLDNIVGRESS